MRAHRQLTWDILIIMGIAFLLTFGAHINHRVRHRNLMRFATPHAGEMNHHHKDWWVNPNPELDQ